jgi:signal transduction histidine kinase/ActR/RegA family two-component response regulator
MIEEYHLSGFDYSLFYDLAVFVLILCAGMILFTFWLRSQKRTWRFLTASWGVFFCVLFLGSFCVVSSVRTQQFLWFNYFVKTTNSYAHVLMGFENWKILAGQKQFFSDWSPSAASVWIETLTAPAISSAPPVTLLADKKLATPQGLSIFLGNKTLSPDYTSPQLRRNQWSIAALTGKSIPIEDKQDKAVKQAVVTWNTVPGASVYRLQWKEDKSDTEWLDVYTGSVPSAVLMVPENVTLLFRVRAEDGTPEDDPIYLRLHDICDIPVTANPHIGYVYSMRYSENKQLQFVVSPVSDANHNRHIDITEIPGSIGDPYNYDSITLTYVLQHRKSVISVVPFTDEWGTWYTVLIPLWNPDEEFDGVFGVDFHAEALRNNISRGKVYPYSFCFAVMVLFFGGTVLITRLQRDKEKQMQLAETLQFMVLELTEAEQAAENASRIKTQFLANMSHELRTPLNAILGLSDIVERQLAAENNTRFDEPLKQIQSSGNNLLSIINDILEYAVIDGKEFKIEFVPINLRQLLHEIVLVMESRIENKPVTLTVTELGIIPEYILSDPARIRQVLINLIGNAIKFTEKGTIRIEYGADTASAVISTIKEDKNFANRNDTTKLAVCFSISDTGIGIAPDDLALIFRPFSQADASLTRRYGGTGIGLSVSKNVAEMLGGRIDVSSTLGVGSTFTFTFKALTADSETILKKTNVSKIETEAAVSSSMPNSTITVTVEPGQPRVLTNRRVLVVEDGKVNQLVITAQLKEAGAEVTVADNGQIGIDKINEAEVTGRPFDIVLMDMQMPALDGYEATAQLRKQGYRRPIIAVTAHALPGDREKTLEAGCDEYLSKPVNKKMLIEVIQSFLEKDGSRNQATK